jgi:hypothetical protein
MSMKLSAIITTTFDGATLGDLDTWVSELGSYGVGVNDEALDGAQIHPEGDPSDNLRTFAVAKGRVVDLETIRDWIQNRYADGYSESSAVVGRDLCFDLKVIDIEEIDCSECPPSRDATDILVTTHNCVRFS